MDFSCNHPPSRSAQRALVALVVLFTLFLLGANEGSCLPAQAEPSITACGEVGGNRYAVLIGDDLNGTVAANPEESNDSTVVLGGGLTGLAPLLHDRGSTAAGQGALQTAALNLHPQCSEGERVNMLVWVQSAQQIGELAPGTPRVPDYLSTYTVSLRGEPLETVEEGLWGGEFDCEDTQSLGFAAVDDGSFVLATSLGVVTADEPCHVAALPAVAGGVAACTASGACIAAVATVLVSAGYFATTEEAQAALEELAERLADGTSSTAATVEQWAREALEDSLDTARLTAALMQGIWEFVNKGGSQAPAKPQTFTPKSLDIGKEVKRAQHYRQASVACAVEPPSELIAGQSYDRCAPLVDATDGIPKLRSLSQKQEVTRRDGTKALVYCDQETIDCIAELKHDLVGAPVSFSLCDGFSLACKDLNPHGATTTCEMFKKRVDRIGLCAEVRMFENYACYDPADDGHNVKVSEAVNAYNKCMKKWFNMYNSRTSPGSNIHDPTCETHNPNDYVRDNPGDPVHPDGSWLSCYE